MGRLDERALAEQVPQIGRRCVGRGDREEHGPRIVARAILARVTGYVRRTSIAAISLAASTCTAANPSLASVGSEARIASCWRST